MRAAVVASLGLAASLVMKINMEVLMSASIAMTAHVGIVAVCLVVGTWLLGSAVESLNEESTDRRDHPILTKSSQREVRFLPSPPFSVIQ